MKQLVTIVFVLLAGATLTARAQHPVSPAPVAPAPIDSTKLACKDQMEGSQKARMAVAECLNSWSMFDKPEPKDDCSKVLKGYTDASKKWRACMKAPAKK